MTSNGGGTGRRPGPASAMRMLQVGRFFGVPLYFAPSWLIIAALLTYYYAPVTRDAVPGLSRGWSYLLAFAYAVVFAGCVLAHELGHTAVSLALKKPVLRIVIFLLGGVSEIEGEPDRPRDEFLIAAAGPAVSGVITAGFGVGAALLDVHTAPGVFVVLLFWSNLVVFVFNLLPGLPLDGGRVLRAGIWAASKSQLTGTRAGAWAGRGLAVALVIVTLFLGGGQFVNGLVGVMLAAYLWIGAGQTLRVAEVMDRVPKLDVETLLRPGLLVPDSLSVEAALQRMWQGTARGLVIVDSADRPAAIVEEARVSAVAPDQRPWVALSTVARPLEAGLILRRGLSAQELMDAVKKTPASEYLVVDDGGNPAGILATADLAAAIGTAR